jgi:DNA invertase Pin-like site-specific DNA recombinase
MFQMMGVFAELERSMIRERVNAGIARAKAEGKHCGRPFIDTKLEGRIRQALAAPGRRDAQDREAIWRRQAVQSALPELNRQVRGSLARPALL